MKRLKWWIKQRYNPQIGVYYVPCGQLTVKEAKKKESPLYGDNYMMPFATEARYLAEIAHLKAEGQRVST